LNELLNQSRDKIYVGGKSDKADKYIEPTIIDFGTDAAAFDSAAVMQDEIFGPILPVFRFKDFEKDVIKRVRHLPTGKPLALYLLAEDQKLVDMVTRRTTCGGMCVNDCLMHIANADLPFGGVGASGMGSYHGERSMKSFSHEKAVLTKYSWIDQNPLVKPALAARYPPWTEARKFLATVITAPAFAAIKEHIESPTGTKLMLLLLVILLGRKLGFRVVRD